MTDTASAPAAGLSLAAWARASGTSALQTMLSVGTRPGTISFALGLPAPEFFPAAEYGRAAAAVLAEDPRALQYSPPCAPLQAHIAALMAQRGVSCAPEQVFLTSGAQQGIGLLARLLLEPGGEVITDTLCYTGFQQAVEPFMPRLLTVPTDLDTGMDVDAVEALLEGGARPAFIYTVPDGHNPLAVSMSAEKRLRLVELARRFQVPIVEDDPYGFLAYDGPPAHPLRALDREWVLYVGSFSKVLAPALRLGWIIVPPQLVPLLAIAKEALDINTATLAQRTQLDAWLAAHHQTPMMNVVVDEAIAAGAVDVGVIDMPLEPAARGFLQPALLLDLRPEDACGPFAGGRLLHGSPRRRLRHRHVAEHVRHRHRRGIEQRPRVERQRQATLREFRQQETRTATRITPPSASPTTATSSSPGRTTTARCSTTCPVSSAPAARRCSASRRRPPRSAPGCCSSNWSGPRSTTTGPPSCWPPRPRAVSRGPSPAQPASAGPSSGAGGEWPGGKDDLFTGGSSWSRGGHRPWGG